MSNVVTAGEMMGYDIADLWNEIYNAGNAN